MIICFLEMIRRALWNFIKVEWLHLSNCGSFKAVEEVEMPFGIEQ
jgi:hypothetical protein